jgi:cytochrome c-type biogenesis protein CcmH
MTSPVFWLLALLLAAAAFAFLLWPLYRIRRSEGQWPITAVLGSVAIIPLAVALYFTVSTWEPDAALDVRAGPAQMVGQLAARLRENPDDTNGWRLLGRSYQALGQYEHARQAYHEAWTRTAEPDNELKLAYGETMVLTDRDALQGQAGRLFEEVLAVEPNNPTALWWGGVAALESGRGDIARERWSRLLAFNPPDDVAEQLRMLLAMLPGAPPATGPAEVPEGQGGIRVAVRLGDGVTTEALGPQSALFLFARVPGERAPLAAVRRSAADLPTELVLSDADAMLPGRSLSDFDELTLVARLSASGDATERPGDFFAQAQFRRGAQDTIELVIDQRVE